GPARLRQRAVAGGRAAGDGAGAAVGRRLCAGGKMADAARHESPRGRRRMNARARLPRLAGLAVLAAVAFVLGGCGGASKGSSAGEAQADAQSEAAKTLVVGSKNFTESEILGEMLALLAEAHAG